MEIDSVTQLDGHLGFINSYIRETIDQEVSKKMIVKNGHTVSQKNKNLYTVLPTSS